MHEQNKMIRKAENKWMAKTYQMNRNKKEK
jgi:hypothetical protein